ncbi:MAG: HNH endonuclease [Nitrospinota bacterium]
MLNSLKVLVLNNSFAPLHFTAARRAIVMVITGRAEQIECDGIMIHTFTTQFPCPTVIRLNRFIKIPRWGTVPFSKKNVLRRDRKTCQYCGADNVELTIDHIIPRSVGGSSNWLNVVAACKRCNSKKSDRTLEKSGLRLRNKPHVPKFMTLMTQPDTVPESFTNAWEKYLPGQVSSDN